MVPGVDHAEVGPRPAGCGEPLRPALLAHPASEGCTGDAGRCHLQNDLRTDPPALTDPRIVDLQAQGCEVLAEEPTREFALEPSLPLVQILTLKGVHGLTVAAVVLAVSDEVPDQPAAQTAGLRPRCPNLYCL